MPIKDPEKNREYKRKWMADKRKQQKFNAVECNTTTFNKGVETVDPRLSDFGKSDEPKEKILKELQSNLLILFDKNNELKKVFLPCPTCTNMRKKYGGRPDQTWCLCCSLKKNNQAIVPLNLVQQILEMIKKK